MSIWLDYRKAFDSVPHTWIIECLKLAKVHPVLVRAIEMLTRNWSTKLQLQSENEMIESEYIKYLRGIFQGDSLSLLLFILTVNPMFFLLNTTEGYTLGKQGDRNLNITHLFFVDDLKLYSSSVEKAKIQLDIVTTFSNNIGMSFGLDKCAYLCIEHGKRKSLEESIVINDTEIRELDIGETYTYLGVDENIGMNGELNKDKVKREYLRRTRKIWKSELNARNKVTAHNCFAVAMVRPTVGILDWSKQEIRDIDTATRKILAMTGSLNKKSDIDRLYVKRDQGGRGIISIEDRYCIRMISLHEHLEQVKHQNHYLMKVIEHEKNNIVRLSNEFKEEFNELASQLVSEGVENIEKKIKRCLNMHHLKSWEEKVTHGYLQCQIKKNEQINLKETYGWLKSENFSSHVEGYLFSLQEQEINTRAAQKCWERNLDKKRNIDGRCRLCKQKDEDLFHIISSCSSLSNSMYLYYRHDNVGKIIYEEITADEQGKVTRQCRKPPTVTHCNGKEIWWNVPLNLPNKVEHNRPDIIEWDNVNKTCTILEISTPLDTNVTDRTKWKKDLYMPLVAEMSRIYKQYKFKIVPIVVGALGAIPNSLLENLRSLSITGKRLK